MELKIFIEEFLPDYETKENEYWEGYSGGARNDEQLILEFIEKSFPEALQNYKNRIYWEMCGKISSTMKSVQFCENILYSDSQSLNRKI